MFKDSQKYSFYEYHYQNKMKAILIKNYQKTFEKLRLLLYFLMHNTRNFDQKLKAKRRLLR